MRRCLKIRLSYAGNRFDDWADPGWASCMLGGGSFERAELKGLTEASCPRRTTAQCRLRSAA